MSTLNTYNLKSPDSANTNLALDASGNVAIQAGSASAPSIYVTGDTNTGLYSPGADQIAVTTGGTARLFIDSSGRLLVGTTTSNGAQLEVNRPQSVATGLSALLSSPQFSITNSSNWGFPVGAVFKTPLANGGAIVDNAAIWAEWSDTNSAYLGFATRNSGTIAERVRIDSSGRLLVGTTTARSNVDTPGGNSTPFVQIETAAGSYSNGLSIINNSVGTFAPIVTLGATNGSSVGSNVIVSNGQYFGTINFVGADGTSLIEGASIRGEVDGTPGANDMPGRLVFSTTADGASSPTERMRITSGGISYVYNDAGSTALIASTSAGSDTTVVLAVKHSATTITGGTDAYYIRANGSAGSASDVNLKKNIETTRDGYLEDLNRLRVVKYNWNGQEDTKPRELGLIAQEVEEVFPGLVCDMSGQDENGKKTTHKGIVYSVLPIMLLKALQEADAKIEAQSAFITSLEARLAALEAQ